jgi:hypothetical protein
LLSEENAAGVPAEERQAGETLLYEYAVEEHFGTLKDLQDLEASRQLFAATLKGRAKCV